MRTKNHKRESEFVQTPFSHSTLKLERKKFHAAKPLAFSLHFLFRRDQNPYSNLNSKIMKMCERILKRPNSLNSKKQEKANHSPSYRCEAIKHSRQIAGIAAKE